MDRIVEDLESGVDRLLGRYSAVLSERDRIASEKSALEDCVKGLEARLLSYQEALTRLESEKSRSERLRDEGVRALDGLISRLESVEPGELDDAALLTEAVIPEDRTEVKRFESIRPIVDQKDPFEESVARLKAISLDRERVREAAAGGTRIF